MRTRMEMEMNVRRKRKVERLTSPRRKKRTKSPPTTGQRRSAEGAWCIPSSTMAPRFSANRQRPRQ
ncbi:hypothetical protein BC827DRAFT_1246725 [Russula dissimulans]|nr:hypothetical protein BC827DRAFT_1246725 [Russula dissimulans]